MCSVTGPHEGHHSNCASCPSCINNSAILLSFHPCIHSMEILVILDLVFRNILLLPASPASYQHYYAGISVSLLSASCPTTADFPGLTCPTLVSKIQSWDHWLPFPPWVGWSDREASRSNEGIRCDGFEDCMSAQKSPFTHLGFVFQCEI